MVDYQAFLDSINREAYHAGELTWEEDGYTVTVPRSDYRREVLAFAQKIEDFYNSAEPRELSGEQWERDVYGLFWKEWHRRKGPQLDF